jgi:hypothetical protein
MTDASALLGTWTMLSWRREVVATGEQSDVLGPNPVGYISYAPDGRMHAIVIKRDRDPAKSTPMAEADKARLFDGMLAYAGRYTLFPDRVVHHIDAAWNPAWAGTDQVRFYKLAEKRLSIHADPSKDPYTGHDVLFRMEFEKR